uniref:Integrase catalytic domain-containing protein n=1 Tax=Meloidogyne javanica TaxID=6303 RepID=A0A915LQF3_MELJA
MPDLPKERILRSKPFQNTGLDYAGPFEVKNSSGEIVKVWIEIFSCMATRFTHLELVPSLSAKSCIQAMRRFISEYGKPNYFISDNGTQYKLTCKVIQEIEQKTEKAKIHWHFIPSLSPWFGGLYEAMKEPPSPSKVETDWQESYKKLEGKYLTLEEKLNSVENDLLKEKIEKEAIELTEKEKSKEELNNEIERHKNDLIRIRTEFCTPKKEREDKGSNQKSKQTSALKVLAKSS